MDVEPASWSLRPSTPPICRIPIPCSEIKLNLKLVGPAHDQLKPAKDQHKPDKDRHKPAKDQLKPASHASKHT